MAATSHSPGAFGIASAQTGIILHNYSFNYVQEKKPLKNHTGETIGIVYLDEKVEVKLQGTLPTSSPFSSTLAATLTLANAFPDFLKGSGTGGSLFIEEISAEYDAEDYATIELSCVYYPAIASA